jgi:hypothetical protein
VSTRSFQRRYRRVWLERQCGATYRQIVAALARCGRSLRSTSDRDVVRLVRERLRLELALRQSTAEAIVQLAVETGRSRRWVVAALRRLGLSPLEWPLDALRSFAKDVADAANARRSRRHAERLQLVANGSLVEAERSTRLADVHVVDL